MATPDPASPLTANDGCAPTRSAIIAGTVTGHHLLDIEGYSRTKELLPNGKSIKSHPFSVGGHSWNISYYPNGINPDYADFISVFLALHQSGVEAVKAQATFSLLDQDGKPVPSHTLVTSLREHSSTQGGYGFGQFIERAVLENSEHLKDDRFTIRCDVAIKKLRVEERTFVSPLVHVPPSDLHRHLGDLLETKEGADVTFQVASETFRAHR